MAVKRTESKTSTQSGELSGELSKWKVSNTNKLKNHKSRTSYLQNIVKLQSSVKIVRPLRNSEANFLGNFQNCAVQINSSCTPEALQNLDRNIS